jgi:hypothetical protein
MYHTSTRGQHGLPPDVLSTQLPVAHFDWIKQQTEALRRAGEDWRAGTHALWLATQTHSVAHGHALAEAASVLLCTLRRQDGTLTAPTPRMIEEMDPLLASSVRDYLTQFIRYKRSFISRVDGVVERAQLMHSVKDTEHLRDSLVPWSHGAMSDEKFEVCGWKMVQSPEEVRSRRRRVVERMYTPEAWTAVVQMYQLPDTMSPEDQLGVLLQPTAQQLEKQVLAATGATTRADALQQVRNAPGGSKVLRCARHTAPTGAGAYVGVLAGSPPGSFPVWDLRHINAALAYAHNARYPRRLQEALILLFGTCSL